MKFFRTAIALLVCLITFTSFSPPAFAFTNLCNDYLSNFPSYVQQAANTASSQSSLSAKLSTFENELIQLGDTLGREPKYGGESISFVYDFYLVIPNNFAWYRYAAYPTPPVGNYARAEVGNDYYLAGVYQCAIGGSGFSVENRSEIERVETLDSSQ
ncbi:MAG: hypothetical protein F6J86_09900 [Symploca sp. SIO1B1]|nr:hypothetical protein [Symploca sp. SIO1B1]